MKKIWLWILGVLYMSVMITCKAETISFEEYVSSIQEIKDSKDSFSTQAIGKEFMKVKDNECTFEKDKNNNWLIKPICFRYNNLPELEFQDTIDIIWPYVEWFDSVYNEQSISFDYQPTLPRLSKNSFKEYLKLRNSHAEKVVVSYHEQNNDTIVVPQELLAYLQVQRYGFYAVYKDLSKLKGCALQNYNVAFSVLDKQSIQAGESLNLNNEISNLPWYCKGKSQKQYMFYGGVCGVSTQLFRLSLLVPGLLTTQRHNHSQRWVNYYNEYIFGDDAAMYEMNKQFEIQNTLPYQIYLRTIENNHNNYLIAITPEIQEKYIRITKEQTDKLSSKVTKEVFYSSDKNISTEQVFSSNYSKKRYGWN